MPRALWGWAFSYERGYSVNQTQETGCEPAYIRKGCVRLHNLTYFLAVALVDRAATAAPPFSLCMHALQEYLAHKKQRPLRTLQ